MSNSPRMPLPIERVGDVLAHFYHADQNGNPEFGVWLHALVERDRLVEAAENKNELRPELFDGIAFWSDIALITEGIAEEQDPGYVRRDREIRTYKQDRIEKVAATVMGAETLISMTSERNFSDEELIGIVEAYFAAEEAFLTSGDPSKSFWETNKGYAQDQVGSWDQAQDLEAMIITARHLDREREEPEYAKRVNAVAKRLGMLHATHGNVGRAIALLSVMDDREEISPLLGVVVDAMEADKAKYGKEYYQKTYHYAGIMLKGKDTLAAFRELLLPAEIPLINGARRRFESVGNTRLMIETWADETPIDACTTNGQKIALPFTFFEQRGVFGRRSEMEHSIREPQYHVNYTELDPELRTRVVRRLVEVNDPTMNPVIDADREPVDKIVFGMGFQLLGLDVSEDEWKLLPALDPKRIYEGKHRAVEIRAIEEMGDTDWLITAYSGWYMQMEGFSHNDILRIAPEGANAFWIAGNPRLVEVPQHLADIGKTKVVLTPIKFYKAEKSL